MSKLSEFLNDPVLQEAIRKNNEFQEYLRKESKIVSFPSRGKRPQFRRLNRTQVKKLLRDLKPLVVSKPLPIAHPALVNPPHDYHDRYREFPTDSLVGIPKWWKNS